MSLSFRAAASAALVLCLGTASLLGAPLSSAKADSLRSRFETRQRETKTWTADFTQTLRMPGMKAPVISEGTILYRAPDDLRIDFAKPAGEFVLILGDRLFVQKPGKRTTEKSLRNDNSGRAFLSLLGLLQGRPTESEEHFDQEVTQQGGAYVIVLTKKPDASKRLPRRITNVVAESSYNIREILVELPNGGSLAYSFRNISRNEPISAKAFAGPEAE